MSRYPVPRVHVSDRARVWRSAALVLGLASLLTVGEAIATEPGERLTTLATGALPLAGAVAALTYGPRLRPASSYLMGRLFVLVGVLNNAVSVALWSPSTVGGGLVYHYVTAALFTGLFLARRDVIALVLITGAAQAAALSGDDSVAETVLVWTMTVLAVTGTSVVLHVVARRMEELSYRDPLTGAGNRRSWEVALGQAATEPRLLSVVLIDLDDLKRVNDREGHEAGDAFLTEAVRAWIPHLRPVDTLVRLGGDEFGVLLPGVTHEGAVACAADLAAALTAGTGRTCSVGVATVQPPVEPGVLVGAADARLYDAKRSGRGCVRGTDLTAGPDAVARAAA